MSAQAVGVRVRLCRVEEPDQASSSAAPAPRAATQPCYHYLDERLHLITS